ncbi:MAG: sialidase family protein [Elusimicrobiota bacterium]
MIHKNKLLPPGKENPRNSEGSFINLKDGKIAFLYSRFYGGIGGDLDFANLSARYSSDGGLTWTKEDDVIIKNDGQCNVMSGDFVRLSTGDILLGFLWKNSYADCQFVVIKSTDEMNTWTPRVRVTTELCYHVVNNDRLVQLSSGRIIAPAALHYSLDGKSFNKRSKVATFYSDDIGSTWKKSTVVLESPVADRVTVDAFEEKRVHVTGLQEPGLVELKDGRLLLWARTDLGTQYYSYSSDCGDTWSPPEPSTLISPCAPASIKRIPATGDLLAVYNDHSGRFPFGKWKRTPLVTAISKDEGKTWVNHKVLEDDPDGWYCYAAINFYQDNVLLAYCAGDKVVGRLNQTQITVFDLDYLYK